METLVKIGTIVSTMIAYAMYQYGIISELMYVLVGLTIFNSCLVLMIIWRSIHRG